MFDIFFSVNHGLSVDFPFLSLSISTPALVVALVLVVAVKVAKVVKARKSEPSFSVATSDWDAEPTPFSWEG